MAENLSSPSQLPIFHLISYIILHDFSLLCSFILSHPLYSSYFIYFVPYFIRLISFISPLFIAAVLLSLLLTTTTALCPKLPQLKLGILEVVLQELKSNLYDVNGDEECRFEDFEIYKLVFDGTLSITIGDECDEQVSTSEKKILQVSVHTGRKNDVRTSDSGMEKLGLEKIIVSDSGMEKLGLEKIIENSVSVGRINDDTTTDSVMEKNFPQVPVHRSRKNDVTTSDSGMDKLGLEKIIENSVSVGRTNDDTTTESVTEKNFPQVPVHRSRKNDVTTSDSGMEKSGLENIIENSVSVGRTNDDSTTDSVTVKNFLEVSVHISRKNDVKTSDSGMVKLGLENIIENSVGVDWINDDTTIDLGFEEKILEDDEVRGGRRNEVRMSDSDVVKLEEEKGLEKLFEELDRFEDCTTTIESFEDSDKVIEELRKAELIPVKKVVSGSEAVVNSSDNKKNEIPFRSSSWRSNSSSNLSSHGSMREEKEWRKTLACKLFEERHNSRGGEEGMDSLWEAYENDNSKNRKEIRINNNNNKMIVKNSSKVGIQTFDEEEIDDDDDDDEDEQGMNNGHLCCLQALKLSTRKMNLGMGKPNLLKISKALRGFGWLHHVKNKNKNKQGKKS